MMVERDNAQELAKLEDIFRAGFITEEEYESRRSAFQPPSETTEKHGQSVKVEPLADRVAEFGLSFAVVRLSDASDVGWLREAFRDGAVLTLEQCGGASAVIGMCPAADGLFRDISAQMYPSVGELFDDPSGSKVALVFTPAMAMDVAVRLEGVVSVPVYPESVEPPCEGDISEVFVTVLNGDTELAPATTRVFQECNVCTKIQRGQVSVVKDVCVVAPGDPVAAPVAELIAALPKSCLAYSRPCPVVVGRVIGGDVACDVKFGSRLAAGDSVRALVARGLMDIASVGFEIEGARDVLPRAMLFVRAGILSVLALKREVEEMVEHRKEQERIDEERRQLLERIAVERERIDAEERSLAAEMEAQQGLLAEETALLTDEARVFEEEEFPRLKEKYNADNFSVPGVHLTAVAGTNKAASPGDKGARCISCLVEVKVGLPSKDEMASLGSSRPPFNLCICLDKSGSMDGSSMDNAKRAIIGLLDKLIPGDVVHLVTYGNLAEVVFRDGTFDMIKDLAEVVSGTVASGLTNISDGLKVSYDLLVKSSASGHRRVFMFSDGQANLGVCNPKELASIVGSAHSESGIVTSSFGIGGDYNSELMKAVADAGDGSFHYIDCGESIPTILDKAFRGISALIATECSLSITPFAGVRITSGACGSTRIGDLRLKDVKQFLTEVEVEGDDGGDVRKLILCRLKYEEVKGLPDVLKRIAAVPEPVLLSCSFGSIAEEPSIVALKAIRTCGDIDRRVLDALHCGGWRTAVSLKRQAVKLLAEVGANDTYGFARVLLHKAKKTLIDYRQQELRQIVDEQHAANKKTIDEFNTALRKVDLQSEQLVYSSKPQVVAAGSSRDERAMKKEAECRVMEEEDCDLGFSLFE